jgi:hypothetical protein
MPRAFNLTLSTTRAYTVQQLKNGYDPGEVHIIPVDMVNPKSEIKLATDDIVDATDTTITAQKNTAKADSHEDVDIEKNNMEILRGTAKDDIDDDFDAVIAAGDGDATWEAAVNALRVTVKGRVDTIVYDSTPVKAAIDTNIDGIVYDPAATKADIDGAVGDVLPNAIDATDTLYNILDTMNEDIKAAIAELHAIVCGRCGGAGDYSRSQDTGNPDDAAIRVHDRTCDGYGAVDTTEQAVPTNSWQEQPSTLF